MNWITHELDHATKTTAVLKQVVNRRKAMNGKNSRTALGNTRDDIQETRDDNGCDDAEEEDDNEDEEHGKGPGMLQQECKTRWSSTDAMGGMLQQECKTRWSSTHAMGDMLQQECKTRWTSTHAMSDSLMKMSQFPRLVRMARQYLTVVVRFALRDS